MPFRFSLEAVLHFRQSAEHQQELRLRAANQHLSRTRHLLEQIDRRIGETRAHRAQQLHTGTTAAELRFALASEAALAEHRQIVLRELARLEKLRDAQQKLFEQARRERETFSTLRAGQKRAYDRLAARREQRAADDLFLLRQAYAKRIAARLEAAGDGSDEHSLIASPTDPSRTH